MTHNRYQQRSDAHVPFDDILFAVASRQASVDGCLSQSFSADAETAAAARQRELVWECARLHAAAASASRRSQGAARRTDAASTTVVRYLYLPIELCSGGRQFAREKLRSHATSFSRFCRGLAVINWRLASDVGEDS